MTKYYGVMVDSLTGDVDDLEVDSDIEKPQTEWAGLTFAKWFKTVKKRDDAKKYLVWVIDFHRKNGREPTNKEISMRKKKLKG